MEVPPTTVEFQDGETHKEIIVRVIPLEDFNGTLEFGLFIDRATAKGAGVGKYLHTTTVKIIDQSYFPRNRLGPFVKGGDRDRIKQIHPAVLVLEGGADPHAGAPAPLTLLRKAAAAGNGDAHALVLEFEAAAGRMSRTLEASEVRSLSANPDEKGAGPSGPAPQAP